MDDIPSWEADSRLYDKEFSHEPAFYGTISFITSSTESQHQSVFWARWVHFTASQFSLWLILMYPPIYAYFFHVVATQVVSQSIMDALLTCPMCATCHTHFLILDLLTLITLHQGYKLGYSWPWKNYLPPSWVQVFSAICSHPFSVYFISPGWEIRFHIDLRKKVTITQAI
jgi:hypothetical protein